MQTIHKYKVPITDEFDLILPQGAKLLHVEEQHNTACIWALVETDNPVTCRTFRVFGTGHPIDRAGTHVGTFLTNGGNLVWHLFDYGENFKSI